MEIKTGGKIMKNLSKSTNLTVKLGLLSAIAFILMLFEFPILPAYGFLKIDLSDIPVLIGAFAFGPLAGIIVEAIKNVLFILIRGTQTGGIGELANFIIGASFIGTAGLIYKQKKTRKTALISLIAAIIIMSVAGVLANYFILIPLYFKALPTDQIIKYLIYGIVPFNLIKGFLISAVTLVIYKRVSILIHAENIGEEQSCNKTA